MSEEKNLAYWKKNAEEDYVKVPISVLRYISELEENQKRIDEMFESLERSSFYNKAVISNVELFIKSWKRDINPSKKPILPCVDKTKI
jgi:hypothetical protein